MKNHLLKTRKGIPKKLLKSLFLMVMIFFSAFGYAQATADVYDFQMTDVTVADALDEIENKSNHTFLFKNDIIDLTRKVDLNVRGSLDQVLEALLSDTDLTYSIMQRQIVLTKKGERAAVDLPQMEDFLHKGIVKDADREPVIGATVFNKRTDAGTVTDLDGTYAILASVGDTIVIQSLGFDDVVYAVETGADESVEIILEDGSIVLDAVSVVSTGYQRISKERATGAFEAVDEKTFDRKINTNILSELNGEVAGVLFSGGINGDDSELVIRGLSSINANTSPLIVVDGFPIEGGIKSINPNDVESITVLKDAAAASIWGVRATNGVIVIITKKGNRDKGLQVDFSVNASIIQKPDLNSSLLASPASQVEYLTELYDALGTNTSEPYLGGPVTSINRWSMNPIMETLWLRDNGYLTSAEADSEIQRLSQLDVRDELLKYIYQPQTNQQYNISFAGGGPRQDYRISFIHNRSEDQIVGTGGEDYTINMTNNIDLTESLKLRAGLNSYISNRRLEPTGGDDDLFFGIDPNSAIQEISLFQRILDDDGNYVAVRDELAPSQEASDALQAMGFPLPWNLNWKREVDNNDHKLNDRQTRLQLGLDYDISDDLKISGLYQYEWGNSNLRDHHNTNRFHTMTTVNSFSSIDPDTGERVNGVPVGGIADFEESSFSSETFRTQIDYAKTLGATNKHEINAIAGYEVRKIVNDFRSYRRYGYDDQSLAFQLPNYVDLLPRASFIFGTERIPNPSEIRQIENRFLSYYFNAAYTFDYRYSLSFSTRLDDTNLFGVSDATRNKPLYSIGAKWNVAQEEWFKSNTITGLNIRATYGTNGNVVEGTSPFLQTSVGQSSAYNNNSAYLTSLPNPQLRLEKTETINLGVDADLWDGRVRLTADFYNKNSVDLLAPQTVNSTLGATSLLLNSGDLYNRGVDLSLRFHVVKSTDFNYFTTGNFSYNENRVTKTDFVNPFIRSYYFGTDQVVEGDPLRSLYSLNYAGLDGNGYPQYIDGSGEIVPSSVAVTDINALVTGRSRIAPYFGSWINDVQYKNWSLRTLLVFQAGHDFRRDNIWRPFDVFFVGNVLSEFEDRWRQRGDENTTNIPRIPDFNDSFSEGFFNYRSTDLFVDDASSIRLQEIILSYSLGAKALEKIKLSDLQFSFQINNLKTWNFNQWDIDPYFDYELLRIRPNYSFGLQASF